PCVPCSKTPQRCGVSLWAKKRRIVLSSEPMGSKTCRVTIRDMEGVDHTAQVSADSLYEAVARGLVAIQKSSWSEDLTNGVVKVIVQDPTVEHAVELRKFQTWIQSSPRSPRERVQHQKVE